MQAQSEKVDKPIVLGAFAHHFHLLTSCPFALFFALLLPMEATPQTNAFLLLFIAEHFGLEKQKKIKNLG